VGGTQKKLRTHQNVIGIIETKEKGKKKSAGTAGIIFTRKAEGGGEQKRKGRDDCARKKTIETIGEKNLLCIGKRKIRETASAFRVGRERRKKKKRKNRTRNSTIGGGRNSDSVKGRGLVSEKEKGRGEEECVCLVTRGPGKRLRNGGSRRCRRKRRAGRLLR